MTRLYKHLRVHQIFGANTDVGKSVLTTALCRISALQPKRVFYLKPVSTGPLEEADDSHVKQYCGRFRNLVQTQCLFRYTEPVSPHLAVRASQKTLFPSDEELVAAIGSHIDICAQAPEPGVLYLETAGGPHSPVMTGTTQADAYRPLLLPTLLVGDAKLGGISSTISTYETLLLRGYSIDGVAMFQDTYYRNFEYLAEYFAERGIPFASVPPPPKLVKDLDENTKSTESYYSQIVDSKQNSELSSLDTHLDKIHVQRHKDLESMPKRTLDTVWWPFVQHRLVDDAQDVTVIDSACGDFFSVYNGSPALAPTQSSTSLLSPKFDGSASWWTQGVGHGHIGLTLAAARAAGRYGHVIFPQATHLPALRLAERLVHQGPGVGWASRAYFSDDGSTGMEIALKMALRAFAKQAGWKKSPHSELGVLGIKGSYHGDTIGAMDACEEGIFTCEWHKAKGYWLEPPTVGIQKGHPSVTIPHCMLALSERTLLTFDTLSAIYDVEARLSSPLAKRYESFIFESLSRIQDREQPKLAALVIEPLVMGAGGMIFVDPLFQRILVDTVRTWTNTRSPLPVRLKETERQGIPVIFDEVFTGLYRVGMQTCSTLLGVKPDIAVYAKILTGGLVPMAITLASDSIYRAFLGESKAEALLHGHSYTAHPVGCEVANEALDLIDKMTHSDEWNLAKSQWQDTSKATQETSPVIWSFWDRHFVNTLSMSPSVVETMTLGTVLAFKLRDNGGGYGSTSAQSALTFLRDASIPHGSLVPFGVHFRALGNVAYFMCSLNTCHTTLRALEDTILKGLRRES